MAIWDRLTGGIIGLGIGGAIGRAARPVFELVEQQAWHGNRNRVLPLGALAELVAQGTVELVDAADEAGRQGYDSNRLQAVAQLALRAPTVAQAMDMRRRGVIGDAAFRHALRKSGLEPDYDAAAFALLEVLPSVTDLVLMAVREVFDPAQRAALSLDAEFPGAFAERAAALGISEALARDQWAAHWQLPSYEQLAEMRFRGELTAGGFRDALKAIDYAPTWRDKLETIARRIPTVPDFTRMAVREVYEPQTRAALGLDAEFPQVFATKVALHGMSEQDARDLWAAHWRLPSAQQGYRMLWRNVIDAVQLRGLLKALDYPPLWRDRLEAISHIVPGRIDLKRLLRHEIFTRAQLVEGYKQLGYSPVHAEAMTQIAEAELASGETGQPWATRARSRLYTVAHNEFIDGSIDETQAGAHLDQIGVSSAERQTVLGLWGVERTISRLELTPAQVRKAYMKELYDEATAISELVERGMSGDDARTFLGSA